MVRALSSLLILVAGIMLFVRPANAGADCKLAAKLSDDAFAVFATAPAQAAIKLREAIAYCPASAALRYNLALTLYDLGNKKEAEMTLEEALKINPDYPKALNDLANILYRKGGNERGRAEYLAQRALKLDPRNREYQQTLDMMAFNIEKAPKTTQYRPDAVAIIIANRKYNNNEIPEVKYAYDDAKSVRMYLIQTFGIPEANIIEKADAPLSEIQGLFGSKEEHRGTLYSRTRESKSEIFIYYVGHGAPDSIAQKVYLVPSDAHPDMIRIQGYPLETLYDNLAKLSDEKKPKSITLVLDTCFSGGSAGGMLIKNASPIYLEAPMPTAKLKNTVIFTSAKSNQISSWYPDKNHSLFTYFFLKSIKTAVEENNTVSASDLEKTLLGPDGVTDIAWSLYNREQQPQVMGDRSIVYVNPTLPGK
jgi:tetratricopeptide (TPR) repeat protein